MKNHIFCAFLRTKKTSAGLFKSQYLGDCTEGCRICHLSPPQAFPAEGYEFVEWRGMEDSYADSKWKVDLLSKDIEVKVVFAKTGENKEVSVDQSESDESANPEQDEVPASKVEEE